MQKVLLIVLAILLTPSAFGRAFNHRASLRHLQARLEAGDRLELARETDRTLSSIVRMAAWKLKATGHRDEADRIEREYANEFSGYVARLASLEAIGDHAPLSQWLSDQYVLLSILLGEQAMKALHLDDIMTVNYGLPVVFHMASIGNEVVDARDYSDHFCPLMGVFGYWGTWASCVAVTWGLGAVTFICTPAGMIAEHVTLNFVAPRFTDRFHAIFYP